MITPPLAASVARLLRQSLLAHQRTAATITGLARIRTLPISPAPRPARRPLAPLSTH
jgi:hypothetical protein